MQTNARRIDRRRAALLVVDIQERLFPAMFEQERVLHNALCLVQGCATLGVPVFMTEQYRKGLGSTLPELAAATPDFAPMEKLTFSSCGAPGLMDAMRARQIVDVIICGIEAHVCVTQTCLELVVHGLNPFVAVDAVSSRTAENWRAGIERMRGAGAVMVSTEMVLFELLERAGTEEFKRILSIVK